LDGGDLLGYLEMISSQSIIRDIDTSLIKKLQILKGNDATPNVEFLCKTQ
jgi:serine/threonine protein kinase